MLSGIEKLVVVKYEELQMKARRRRGERCRWVVVVMVVEGKLKAS